MTRCPECRVVKTPHTHCEVGRPLYDEYVARAEDYARLCAMNATELQRKEARRRMTSARTTWREHTDGS